MTQSLAETIQGWLEVSMRQSGEAMEHFIHQAKQGKAPHEDQLIRYHWQHGHQAALTSVLEELEVRAE